MIGFFICIGLGWLAVRIVGAIIDERMAAWALRRARDKMNSKIKDLRP